MKRNVQNTKRGYLAISYSNRHLFSKEIECLKKVFRENNIELLVFVDTYNFRPEQEREMMKTAFKEIDNSNFLIAELTTKSIGVGIEIGYAFAKQKPIFYLRKKESEYSTTASGCSSYIVEYKNELDLKESMEKFLKMKIGNK